MLLISTVVNELLVVLCRKFPTDLSALLLADLYYTRLSLNGCSAQLSHNSLLEMYQMLHTNCSSNISKVALLFMDAKSHKFLSFDCNCKLS